MSLTPQVRDADTYLIERARSGDTEALTELYRRHERRVYNLALRTLGNPWDAADVAPEASAEAPADAPEASAEAPAEATETDTEPVADAADTPTEES